MAQPKSEQVASLATQFENAFVLSLSITLVRAQPVAIGACVDPVQVTTNAAPPGTAVNVFLLACVAGLLATVSGRLSRRVPRETAESGASSLLWELGQHIVQLGAMLSTTIVRRAPMLLWYRAH